ncbi:MAG: hypothetical protein Q9P90_06395 [candidate division KSB1 bacterium]|nr:hypothetical protein [candidate division KSB1 bacterium]
MMTAFKSSYHEGHEARRSLDFDGLQEAKLSQGLTLNWGLAQWNPAEPSCSRALMGVHFEPRITLIFTDCFGMEMSGDFLGGLRVKHFYKCASWLKKFFDSFANLAIRKNQN